MPQIRNVIRFRSSQYEHRRTDIARALSKMFKCYFKVVYHIDISSKFQLNKSLQRVAATRCNCDGASLLSKNIHTNGCFMSNYFLIRVKKNGECYNHDKTDYTKVYEDFCNYDSEDETKSEPKVEDAEEDYELVDDKDKDKVATLEESDEESDDDNDDAQI